MTEKSNIAPDGLPDEPTVIRRVKAVDYPPHGGWVVWNPRGAGRLRPATTSRVAIDGRTAWHRSPPYCERFLLLDEIPLVRWLSNGCDTCEQILRPIARSPRQLAAWTDAIHDVIRDAVTGPDSEWTDAFRPLVALLTPGFWLLTADEYYPTDGAGRVFWEADCFDNECRSLCHHWDSPNAPMFLIGSQSAEAFSHARFASAQASLHSHPGVALHLGGRLSALLDGHHRALAAASIGGTFMCVTISHLAFSNRCFWSDRDLRIPFSRLPDAARKWAIENHGWAAPTSGLPAQLSDESVASILEHFAPGPPTPLPITIPDLNSTYPTDEDMDSVLRVGGRQRRVSDAAIDRILSAPPDSRNYKDGLARDVLTTLDVLHDIRLIPIATRIARDWAWVWYWLDAYRYLARHRCPEVDDLFVEFLVNDDGSRPEIKAIIDDYFRQEPAARS